MICLPQTEVKAQEILVLTAPGGKIKKIFTQTEIGVKLIGEDEEYYVGYLTGVGDSSILVDGNLFYLNEIASIRVYKPFFKTVGVAQRIAAGGVVGLNATNSLLNDVRPIVTETEWYWAIGLFATSYIWDLFSRRSYDTLEKWEMETIDFANVGE